MRLDARSLRLQREYLRAERLLEKHRVRHTILVMGSTRVTQRDPMYAAAREFGRIVGRSGCAALMTGGGPGIMEAANRGAYEVGAVSIGLNIELPREQPANCYLTPELSLRFRYFALRKLQAAARDPGRPQLLEARGRLRVPACAGQDRRARRQALPPCRKRKRDLERDLRWYRARPGAPARARAWQKPAR